MLSEIKLSPLLLFFTLLIVLVIATTVKRWGLVSEGFIGYLKDANSFSSQTVPAYDSGNAIIKLYDDIFYDNRNGNAVIITASPYVNTADSTGASVSSIDVVPRKMDPIYSYTRGSGNAIMSQQCEESKVKTIESLETQWSVKGPQSTNQLNYITWGNDTYMYVMDLANASMSGNTTSTSGNTTVSGNTTTIGSYRPAVSAYFNGTMKQSTNSYTASDTINLKPTFTYTSDGKDDTNVVVDFYDKVQPVYQVVSNVWFDAKNGNLLIKTNGTGAKLDVYARGSKTSSYSYTAQATGDTTPASQTSFSQTSVAPYFIQDATNDHTIMYWANGDNTILSVFKNMLESNGMVKATKCRRFVRDGLYNANPVTATPKASAAHAVDVSGNNELLDSFARWYIYFNTNAVGSNNSNDYLLKTQIVPPVCPACPGCKTEGVCTDCGGKGGSGTKTTETSSLAFDTKTAVGATGSAVANTVDATGTILGKTVDAAGNVAEKTVDVAGNVVGKTVDVAGNVVGKTFDAAGNVVGRTFDAAGNVLGSTASALGLDRIGYQQSYGGPMNTSSSANASGYPSSSQAYRPGSNSTGVPNYPNSKPNDPYSYNGALQSKGGNFMAITTDFSKFGR